MNRLSFASPPKGRATRRARARGLRCKNGTYHAEDPVKATICAQAQTSVPADKYLMIPRYKRSALVLSIVIATSSCAWLLSGCSAPEGDGNPEHASTETIDATIQAIRELVPAQNTAPPTPQESLGVSNADQAREAQEAANEPPAPDDVHGQQCPAEMLLIEGDYCPGLVHTCVDLITEGVQRCRRFSKHPRCVGSVEKRRFCMDRFEYPNVEGVKPVVMVDWHQAKQACSIEGKRLCLASEWNFACEGNERLPYPYGYDRDTTACNMERPRPTPEPDEHALGLPRSIGAEVGRLDMRVPSGSRKGCVSPFGVQDMTGNVDEWTINEEHFEPPQGDKKPTFISGLKGGYWGPIRAACRPITTAHSATFRFYQIGFRCCADPKEGSDGIAAGYYTRMHVGDVAVP